MKCLFFSVCTCGRHRSYCSDFFRDAMSLNLKGTQNIIKLCRGMKHLEVGNQPKEGSLCKENNNGKEA